MKTEADAVDDGDRDMIKNEWIAHVLERGEEIEKEDGKSQYYLVDVGILVCKKDNSSKKI